MPFKEEEFGRMLELITDLLMKTPNTVMFRVGQNRTYVRRYGVLE